MCDTINNSMKCEICKNEIHKNNIGRHLRIKHYVSCKEYFDLYLKVDTDGLCICGNETKYKGGIRGYNKYCSNSCRASNELKSHVVADITKERIRVALKKSKNAEEHYKRMSLNRKGVNNPRHNRSSEDWKKSYEKQSNTIKEKIKRGEFTPCVTNSWANSRCKLNVDGFSKLYRSSWDAAFQILNIKCEYEKLRIPYISPFDNKEHIYIVDFIDYEDRIVYEIKPTSCKNNSIFKIKEVALIDWCNKNDFGYSIITEEYFQVNAYRINYINYDEKIYKGMKQFL